MAVKSMNGRKVEYTIGDGNINISDIIVFSGEKERMPRIKFSEPFDPLAIAYAVMTVGESLGYNVSQYSGPPYPHGDSDGPSGHIIDLTRKGFPRNSKYSFLFRHQGICFHQRREPIDEVLVGKYSWNTLSELFTRLDDWGDYNKKIPLFLKVRKEYNLFGQDKDEGLISILNGVDRLLFSRLNHDIIPDRWNKG